MSDVDVNGGAVDTEDFTIQEGTVAAYCAKEKGTVEVLAVRFGDKMNALTNAVKLAVATDENGVAYSNAMIANMRFDVMFLETFVGVEFKTVTRKSGETVYGELLTEYDMITDKGNRSAADRLCAVDRICSIGVYNDMRALFDDMLKDEIERRNNIAFALVGLIRKASETLDSLKEGLTPETIRETIDAFKGLDPKKLSLVKGVLDFNEAKETKGKK